MAELEEIEAFQFLEVPLADIVQDAMFRNRVDVNENMEVLRDSIKKEGQQVPLILRGKTAPYQLISGFRRFAALDNLGVATAKAIVYADLSTERAHRIVVADNLRRESLSPYEQVLTASNMRESGLLVWQIAEAFGVDIRTIQRYLRLKKSSPEVRQALHERLISPSVAYEVETGQISLDEVIHKGLSVRQAKALAQAKKAKPVKMKDTVVFKKYKNGSLNLNIKYKKGLSITDADILRLEEALRLLKAQRGAE
jgi:ParB family chromosome partitioning protein